MKDESNAEAIERKFFNALLGANVRDLDQILADDFVLVDVMGGSEIPKSTLLDLFGSGQLKFVGIEMIESRVRSYPTTAVINGWTLMQGTFNEEPFSVNSRYVHVYIEQQGQWRMVSAQGTPITPALS